MRIPLVKSNITKTDIDELCEWMKQDPTPQLSNGPLVKQFEEKYAQQQKRKYAVMVNSGSSANLLVVALLKAKHLKRNNKVVLNAIAWSTSLSVWLQDGYHVIPCDNDSKTMGIDIEQLKEIFERDRPCALMTVNVLGFPNEYEKVKELCEKYDVFWILDDCEGCDGEYQGKLLSEYGDLVTKSGFISHFISTIESGTVLTDDFETYEVLKMLRSHGMTRDISDENRLKLEKKYGIDEFNGKFTFYVQGYNVRSTEINAFLGLKQLERVEEYRLLRNKNYELYNSLIENDYWKVEPLGDLISPFAYPTITPKRKELIDALKIAEIEHRPIISGNIFSQPMFTSIYEGTSIYDNLKLPFADQVHTEGLYLPLHPDMTKEEIEYVCGVVNSVLNEK